jgi:hypothetical protein
MKEDDNNWPEPDRIGKQELEIVMGDEHISFSVSFHANFELYYKLCGYN